MDIDFQELKNSFCKNMKNLSRWIHYAFRWLILVPRKQYLFMEYSFKWLGGLIIVGYILLGIILPITRSDYRTPSFSKRQVGSASLSSQSLWSGDLLNFNEKKLKDSIFFICENQRPDAQEGEVTLYNKNSHCVINALQNKPYHLDGKSTQLIIYPGEGNKLTFSFALKSSTLHVQSSSKEPSSENSSWEMELYKGKIDALSKDKELFSSLQPHWYGKDMFLYYHGGVDDQQRIELHSNKDKSKHYISIPSQLIQKDSKWISLEYFMGSTKDHALLELGKIEDDELTLSLWPIGGYRSFNQTLNRTKEGWQGEKIASTIRLVGVKSLQTIILEMDGHRIPTHKNDWLFHSYEKGDIKWERLNSLEKIDQYVSGEIEGDLLVILDISKGAKAWEVHARLYSPKRSMCHEFIIQDSQLKPSQSDSNLEEKSYDETRVIPKLHPYEKLDDPVFYWSQEENQDFDEAPILSSEDILEILKSGQIESLLQE